MSSLPPWDSQEPGDPRFSAEDDAARFNAADDLRPKVASTTARRGLGLVIGGAALLGVITFMVMSSQRHAPEKAASFADSSTVGISPAPPAPPDLAMVGPTVRSAAPPVLAAPLIPAPSVPANLGTPPPPAPAKPDPSTLDTPVGRKAPVLVVDLGEGPPTVSSGTTAGASGSGAGLSKPSTTAAASTSDVNTLNADEKFVERVSATEPERSRATVIRNTRETIPQGVMIPGVMETALNSDLPGFARAVVSRDVRGFDGSTVLIPRGSRVIGQYKSAAAQGQSRAFVIWTRIIRPDGASIQIASSGTDPLGRAGLDGKVDRHFFEEFSGAILLTVLDAGVASLANQPSTQVVIGSSTGGAGLGAAAVAPTPIAPTIKVPQGSPIRIFVARDLDFSSVGPAK